jgi:hypothetical protein
MTTLARGKMRLQDTAGNYVDVYRPTYPYTSEIHLPIAMQQASDGSYPDNGIFDPPDSNNVIGTYDYRILKKSTFRIPVEQKADFNVFLRWATHGRAENFYLDLGDEHTGFFLFGIDKGDSGVFTVRIISREQAGPYMAPLRWFEDEIGLVLVSHTAVLPTFDYSHQGKLKIGAAENLMWPQDGIKSKSLYNYQTGVTVSGVPHSIDGPRYSDSWETEFELLCNSGNTYNVVHEIVSTSRANLLSIVTPSNYFIYGMDQSDVNGIGGTFLSRFLGSSREDKEIVLSIEHTGYNQFKIPMRFWLSEKTA